MNASERIGRYEILAEVGRGAMGSVFQARDPIVGRTVALKTIHSAALAGDQSEEYRARFYREARASGVLAHPGIVPVFDVGDHEGAPFLVMEFVEGRTLGEAMKKGERFSLDRVCEIGQQIAEALGYAHRKGVIHRDIKPANILLTSRDVYGIERPRITDFGIAKLAASEITTAGQLLGTPSFMPPEQFTGSPVDGRADLFSLGVILYSLATGEQPFAGETMTAVSYKIVYTEPIPPAKLNPAISPRLEAAILKCLAKNPADRFQTGEELALELTAIRSAATVTTQGPAAPGTAFDADATLAPAQVAAAATMPVSVSGSQTGSPASGAHSTEKPKSKPVQVETAFALVLLAIAGVGIAAAGAWFIFGRALNLLHHRQQASVSTVQQPVQPVVAIPLPNPAPPADQTSPQSSAPGSVSSALSVPGVNPPAAPPASANPAGKTTPPATPPPAVRKSNSPTQPAAIRTPSAPGPAIASTGPAAAPEASPAPPSSAAAPASSSGSGANSPTPPTAPAAFNPRKLDPNANTKLKIEFSKLPNGLPVNVAMDKKPYLNFITGDKTDLDNLYVPAGVQEFRVSIKSGGQQFDSNVVSDDFKAKKKKTLKIEILENGKSPAKIPVPLGKDMQVFLSFPVSPFEF